MSVASAIDSAFLKAETLWGELVVENAFIEAHFVLCKLFYFASFICWQNARTSFSKMTKKSEGQGLV
jgi:hypothetical protein